MQTVVQHLKMRQEEFYSLSFNSNNVELYVEVLGEYDDQNLMIGRYNPNPLNVKKSQGRKMYDIVRLQDVFNFLVSERLIKAFKDAGLTGWKTYNVVSDIELEGHEGFQCTGKCGTPIRPDESGFVTGYDFDRNTWDGSDFFIPDTTMMIICTRRAKETIEMFQIKNVELESLTTLKWYSA